jgi:hypothetical protein
MNARGNIPPFASGSFIKNDHFLLGLFIGLMLPLIMFGAITGINYILLSMKIVHNYLDLLTHALVSLFINLLPVRYYFVNLKFDKTGRGVLLLTFVLVLVLFLLKDSIFEPN